VRGGGNPPVDPVEYVTLCLTNELTVDSEFRNCKRAASRRRFYDRKHPPDWRQAEPDPFGWKTRMSP